MKIIKKLFLCICVIILCMNIPVSLAIEDTYPPLYQQLGFSDSEAFLQNWDIKISYEDTVTRVMHHYNRTVNNPQRMIQTYQKLDSSIATVQDVCNYRSFKDENEAYLIYSLGCTLEEEGEYLVPYSVEYNGQFIPLHGDRPELKNGRIMVPVRHIMEYLNATVEFDDTQKRVLIITSDIILDFVVGDATLRVQADSVRTTIEMDCAPYINEGRTYVPVRFFSEALGINVAWDAETKYVIMEGNLPIIEPYVAY